MSPALAQREIALAGVALLALLVSLALGSTGSEEGSAKDVPRPVTVGEGWYDALAAPRGGPYGRRSACGQVLRRATLGVAHPVLPCGAKIFISFEGKEVLTQIVDRGPRAPGLDFEVSAALAQRLGLEGTQRIRWSFAR
ncbi:MAG: septal ring lytic transglycosylase RlpA family protein [Gaiellaceae bacterium]